MGILIRRSFEPGDVVIEIGEEIPLTVYENCYDNRYLMKFKHRDTWVRYSKEYVEKNFVLVNPFRVRDWSKGREAND